MRFLSLRGERNQRRAGAAAPRPRGCPAFPSPLTFPSALGRLVPLSLIHILEIYNMVSDVSPNTVNVVLSALEKEGKIRRIGRTRNTKYVRVS